MSREELMKAIGEADEKLLFRSEEGAKKELPRKNKERAGKHRLWIRAAAVAACMAVVLTAGVLLFTPGGEKIRLSDASKDVSVKKIADVSKAPKKDFLLINLTEEEIFTRWNTAIVMGTVKEIQNIVINFNGDKEYRAIARIEVEKLYRGDCSEGDVISVLLPCSIGTDVDVEDTEVVSRMQVGTVGIFMPIIYDENSIWEQNGAVLCEKDIADYGFADGMRFAFLEEDGGIIFERDSYESIKNANSLEEIESYIMEIISK